MPSSTIPSCSCGWLCSGTVAPGSKRIRFSIAPSPKSGRPVTPGNELEGANLVELDELRLHAARLSLPA